MASNTMEIAAQHRDTELWERGRDRFKEMYKGQKKYAADLESFLKDESSPQQAQDVCLKLQDKVEQQYSKGDVTVAGKKVFAKKYLGVILDNVHYFVSAGDYMVKGAPETVGLAWMAIKMMIGAVQQDYATSTFLIEACADVTTILVRTNSKVKTFYDPSKQATEMMQQLIKRIPDIYCQILDFSFWVKRHIRPHNWKRFIPVLPDKFTPRMDAIKKLELEVTKDTSDLFHEQTKDFQARTDNQLDTIERNGEDIKSNLRKLAEKAEKAEKKTPFELAKQELEDNKKKLNPSTTLEQTFEDNLSKVQEGTCDWIWETDQFKEWWNSSNNEVLWLQGNEGSGKSVLAATIINDLRTRTREADSDSDDETVDISRTVYYFCKEGDTFGHIVASLIHQILESEEIAYEFVWKCNDIFNKAQAKKETRPDYGNQSKSQRAHLQLEEILIGLRTLVNKKVFIIIDALDSCSDNEQVESLKGIGRFIDSEDMDVRILVSSRPELGVLEELDGVNELRLDLHNREAIETSTHAELLQLPGFSESDREAACQAIVERADGMFRYVQQGIQFLRQPWQRPLSKRLEALPEGLEGSYSQNLRQVDPDHVELLKTALLWTTLSESRVTLHEIFDDFKRTFKEEHPEGEEIEDEDIDESNEELYVKQMRVAGGVFLEVSGKPKVVNLKNKSVKNFFLDKHNFPNRPPTTTHDVCTECRGKIDADPTFFISEKEGHLNLTITLLEHLNSPAFQRRYIPSVEPEEATEAEEGKAEREAEEEETEGEEEEAKEEEAGENLCVEAVPETNNAPGSTTEAISANSDIANPVPSGEDNPVNGDAVDTDIGNRDADVDAYVEAGGEKVDGEVVEGEEMAENDETDNHSTVSSAADSDDEEELNDAAMNYVGTTGNYNINNNIRYEITHWRHHLRLALELWTDPEERESSPEWQKLWTLLEKFLCENPDVFKAWQRCMWNFPESFLFYCDDEYMSPMHVAAGFGLHWVVEKLIARGDSKEALSTIGRMPIHVAMFSMRDDPEHKLLKLLIEGVDLNRPRLPEVSGDEEPRSFAPAMSYWFNVDPDVDVVQIFLDHGADPCAVNRSNETALHFATLHANKTAVIPLLKQYGGDINAKDQYGETPLHNVMRWDDIPIAMLQAVLENGADVNIEDEESQRPLFEGAGSGNVEAVKLCIEHDADLNDDDVYGITALHAATSKGQADTARCLLEAGAHRNEPDKQGRTPFLYSCQSGDVDTAETVFSFIRDLEISAINTPDNKNKTPFRKAAAHGLLPIVVTLVKLLSKDDLNVKDVATERTALHAAASNGHADVVKFLLESGIDPKLEDSKGNTALTICCQRWEATDATKFEDTLVHLIEHDSEAACENVELLGTLASKGSIRGLDILLNAGADPNAKDEHDWTPMQLAQQYRQKEAIALMQRSISQRGPRPAACVDDSWSVNVTEDGTLLEWVGPCRHVTFSDHPIPSHVKGYYFEVEFLEDEDDQPADPIAAIGFASRNPKSIDWFPGWPWKGVLSWAYHGDDGNKMNGATLSFQEYNLLYRGGNTIGCGVDFRNNTIFFTAAGRCLGRAFDDVSGRLFPVVGMNDAPGMKAKINFGNDLEKNPFKWAPGNGSWEEGAGDEEEEAEEVEEVAEGHEEENEPEDEDGDAETTEENGVNGDGQDKGTHGEAAPTADITVDKVEKAKEEETSTTNSLENKSNGDISSKPNGNALARAATWR